MEQYKDVIIQACLLFPIIALVFSLPYILYNYRKYGSFLSLRITIVYSFILYLICAYFLVILPLPDKEWVAALSSPRVQLIPFQFIKDIQASTTFSLHDVSTYIQALNHPAIYQIVFNIALTMPFGMYLRYYFKCNWKKTLLFSFLLALFFELTQLSGLYGYYERSYRLFDVDDLLINSIGGMFGYIIMKPFMKLLPTREEIDQASYEKGSKVSLPRRMTAFIIDISCIFILYITLKVIFIIPNLFFIIFISYFILIPTLFKGRTFGKLVTNIKIVSTQATNKWYQPFLRYLYLYIPWLVIPIYIYAYLQVAYNDNLLHVNSFMLLTGLLFAIVIICLCFAMIEIATDKYLYYENLSKTKIVSTITLLGNKGETTVDDSTEVNEIIVDKTDNENIINSNKPENNSEPK